MSEAKKKSMNRLTYTALLELSRELRQRMERAEECLRNESDSQDAIEGALTELELGLKSAKGRL